MTDSNVLRFSKFRKKDGNKNPNTIELEIAKNLVNSDPVLKNIAEKIDLPTEEVAAWIVQLPKFQSELDSLVSRYILESRSNPFFAGLILQILAIECSDRLSAIGQHPDISKEAFLNFQKNAILPIVSAKHSSDFISEEFDAFSHGEYADDRSDE